VDEYEYTIAQFDWDAARFDPDELEGGLNAYAARGWEYVHTIVPHTGRPVTVWRRRVQR
jgi:hypothetical protein